MRKAREAAVVEILEAFTRGSGSGSYIRTRKINDYLIEQGFCDEKDRDFDLANIAEALARGLEADGEKAAAERVRAYEGLTALEAAA